MCCCTTLRNVSGQLYTITQASEAGVCRGSNTPPIYVRDIDMYNPLEKSNTYPCKLYATRTEMLGKAI